MRQPTAERGAADVNRKRKSVKHKHMLTPDPFGWI